MKKILLIISLLLLSGCYNYRELNDLAIVSAIAIDYNNSNNNFEVSIQVVNPKKQQDTSSANEPDFIIYKAEEKTLQQAFRNIVDTSPNRIYGSHLEILIISEEVAKNHIDKIFDFFAREPEARSEFSILVAKDSDPEDEISVITPLINLSSTNIKTLLQTNNQNLGVSLEQTFNETLNSYLNPYLEIALPSLELIGKEEKGEKQTNIEQTNSNNKVKLATTAIFKNDKLIGYLTKQESIGLNILLNKTNMTMLSHKCSDNNYFTTEIDKLKSSIDTNIENKEVNIKIEGHSIINEMNCNLNIKNTDTIDKIDKEIENELKKIIENTIYTIQNTYNTDVIGIRDMFYKKNPNYLKKHYNNWDETFKKLNFNVEVNLKLYEKGNTVGGTIYEKKQY